MKKNILSRFLPQDDKQFFNYFEAGAETCREAAQLFYDITQNGLNEERLIKAKNIKHNSNDITKELLIVLNKTFITPMDREDIQKLADLLDKITKRTIRACINLRVYRLQEYNDKMKEQAANLLKATDELKFIVGQLRKVEQVQEITMSNGRMREIESHGDEILYRAMDELFSGKYDALTVIKLRDVYKLIENALDSCFDVSDSILSIAIKQS